MISAWLSDQGIALGPSIALILFFGVFVGVLVWVFRPGSKSIYEHEARLPFDDANGHGRGPQPGGGAPQVTDSTED